MSQNPISILERELLKVLKEEYSFYQSLYILLDKQRELIRFNRDENLLDLYAEVERCQARIRESEQRIEELRAQNPRTFRLAAVHPEIKKTVNSMVTLVKKNIKLVEENETYLKSRHERIQTELSELKNSRKILQYVTNEQSTPQFVDGRQ
jgi:hypothetical protein